MGGFVVGGGEFGSGGGISAIEPPHSIIQARVDDKGRLKLPAEFWEYLKQLGVEKVFITTVDLQLARIYPIPVWKSNENFFASWAIWRSWPKTWPTSQNISAAIRRSMRKGAY